MGLCPKDLHAPKKARLPSQIAHCTYRDSSIHDAPPNPRMTSMSGSWIAPTAVTSSIVLPIV